MDEAIKQIPVIQKAAYLQALKVAPSLLEKESNPNLFLRRENFNSWAAAQRLASYWEERKKAFGEKAFLPLSINSYKEETTRALWEGVFLQLPNDSSGRTVVYRDNKKLAILSLEVRVQLLFYIDNFANNNPRSAEEGIVFITTMEVITFDRNSKTCAYVAQNSLPSRPHSIHVLCNGNNNFEDRVALKLMRWITKDTIYIHVCKTTEERASALVAHGLKRDCLPKFLGGLGKTIPWESFVNLSIGSDQSNQLHNIGWGADEPLYFPSDRAEPSSQAENTHLDKDLLILKEFKDRAHKKLEEIIHGMPNDKKTAYQNALKLAPHLVHTESIPVWFLVFEKYNVHAAARRLAAYWEEREKAFGDNAYQSLTNLTGEVAYNEETIRALREGAAILLPNDNEGRCVIYRDDQKVAGLSLRARIQFQFYTFALAMGNIESIRQGLILLTVMDRIVLKPKTGISANLCKRIMPIPLHTAHVFCKTNTVEVGIVPLWIPCLRWMSTYKTHFHVCLTAEERASKLTSAGFTKAGLPTVLGGYFDAPHSCNGLGAQNITNSIVPNGTDPAHNSPGKASFSHQIQFLGEEGQKINFSGSRQFPSVSVSNNDVLLGKRTKYSSHPGNQILGDYIAKNRARHEEAYQTYEKTRTQKDRRFVQQIHREIYDSIKQTGRFLKCDHEDQTISSDGWYEVDSSIALKKIAASFRYGVNAKSIKQEARPLSQSIQSVSESDILLGKGRKNARHPGNLRFMHLIETHSDRYDEASKNHSNRYGNKASGFMNEIIEEVYASVSETGRFLKTVNHDDPSSPGGWYEITRDDALQKISMSFRNHRKKRKRRPNE